MQNENTKKFNKFLSRCTPAQKVRLVHSRRIASITQYYKKREYYLEKIKCDVCGVCVCRQNMNTHQKTKRCQSSDSS